MEVVSTSNLVSSEIKKITAAFDVSFLNGKTVKNTVKIYKQNSEIKTDQQWAKRKYIIFFKIALSFANNQITAIQGRWSIASQATKILVKTCSREGGVGGHFDGVFLLTPWLIGKKSKESDILWQWRY